MSHCGEQLHSSSPNPEEKPLVVAENELLGAASSIEAVSNKLSQLRPRQVHVSFNLKLLIFYKKLNRQIDSLTTIIILQR